MRHFENELIAKRYDVGRPRLHGLALEAFASEIGHKGKWAKVLDLACGTGHSSEPLQRYADAVVGIDISEAMIAIARQNHPLIQFVVGAAESIPPDCGPLDALFIANGLHWFDQERLLAGVRANLKVGGWLVSYGFGAPSRMLNNPGYEAWYRNEYWGRYPKPQTRSGSLREFVEKSSGVLSGYASLQFTHPLELSPGELRALITTQSNIHQAIETGADIREIDAFLDASLGAFFVSEKAVFPFEVKIEYAIRTGD